jgi:transposase
MSNKTAAISSDFTVERYWELKEKGLRDSDIHDLLFVSKSTFQRWKKANGLEGMCQKYKGGHNRKISQEQAKRMLAAGMPYNRVQLAYDVSKATVYRAAYNQEATVTKVKWNNIANRLMNEKTTMKDIEPFAGGNKSVIDTLKEWFDHA